MECDRHVCYINALTDRSALFDDFELLDCVFAEFERQSICVIMSLFF